MPDIGNAARRRLAMSVVMVAAVSALLAGCGQVEEFPVGAGASPAAASPAPAPAAMSTFQGTVASIDADAGSFVVAVRIVWAPVMAAAAHDRRVVVAAATQWDPGSLALRDLRPGEEVQVEADRAAGGADWRASRIQLFDID